LLSSGSRPSAAAGRRVAAGPAAEARAGYLIYASRSDWLIAGGRSYRKNLSGQDLPEPFDKLGRAVADDWANRVDKAWRESGFHGFADLYGIDMDRTRLRCQLCGEGYALRETQVSAASRIAMPVIGPYCMTDTRVAMEHHQRKTLLGKVLSSFNPAYGLATSATILARRTLNRFQPPENWIDNSLPRLL